MTPYRQSFADFAVIILEVFILHCNSILCSSYPLKVRITIHKKFYPCENMKLHMVCAATRCYGMKYGPTVAILLCGASTAQRLEFI